MILKALYLHGCDRRLPGPVEPSNARCMHLMASRTSLAVPLSSNLKLASIPLWSSRERQVAPVAVSVRASLGAPSGGIEG